MSGTTIDNWNRFNTNVFKNIGVKAEDARADGVEKPGVLTSRIDEVKSSHVHVSTVKKFFLGLITLGIYNICHGVSAKNQRETKAALKAGVDNVHSALSYLSMKSMKEFQKAGAGGNVMNFDGTWVRKAPDIEPGVFEQEELKGSNFTVLTGGADDAVFGEKQFVRTNMGGVQVDIGFINEHSVNVRIKDGEGRGRDSVVTLPSVEDALYNLEKSIAHDSDVFGKDSVEKVLTRYDRRLELEKTVNGANSVGVPKRGSAKDHQLALAREVLTVRYGMSPDRVAYLDRDLAKQLAIQAVKGNVESGEALDALYDKVISQKHFVDVDMAALYAKLDDDPGLGRNVFSLPQAQPMPDGQAAGRPTEAQSAVHDFAADLILGEDISSYDKDVGKSGYLDGQRMRDVFAAHRDTIEALMTERAADGNAVPARLASLEPGMRTAVVKLVDALIAQNAKTVEERGRPEMSAHDFLSGLIADFDSDIAADRRAEAGDKNGRRMQEMDDLAKEIQFNEAGIGTSPKDAFTIRGEMAKKGAEPFDIQLEVERMEEAEKPHEYRRHGKANFFAQVEIELAKEIDEAMKNSVQSQVTDMIADVFPDADPAALSTRNSLEQIAGDRASDPQLTLLRNTLKVYFDKMGTIDKRNMMSRLVRNTVDGASNGLRFGELLKGAGPVLQKMLQGLDPEMFQDPDFRLALDDMRSRLAPIPEKAVKAHFADMIARSAGAITSITVVRSCGAASVSQTFLCSIKLMGEDEPRECVVKMLRPDASLRALREAEVFRAEAKKVDGMENTFEARLATIMRELDLTIEAENVKKGLDAYDTGTHKANKTFRNVSSMRMMNLPGVKPSKHVMVLERAPGVPMDEFVRDANAEIAEAKSAAVDGMRNAENIGIAMLDGAEKATGLYEDALAKHDALSNLTTIWIREGLFTKTGFYHGDLHAGNIMVPTAEDVRNGVQNGVTMIDFGNAVQLSSAEQRNVIRIVAGAAGNDPALFLSGLKDMLPADGKAKVAQHGEEVARMVREILAKGTGNDAGLRMSAVFKMLQVKFSIDVPFAIGNFQMSQERLAVAMESMLRTLTAAEVARVDVILAAAKAEGVEVPNPGANVSPADAFARKRQAAVNYLRGKIDGGNLTEDVRDRYSALVDKLDEAEGHRPMSIMQCMVGVIKQNIGKAILALGGTGRTVRQNLEADGLINAADDAPGGGEKERRFVEIVP